MVAAVLQLLALAVALASVHAAPVLHKTGLHHGGAHNSSAETAAQVLAVKPDLLSSLRRLGVGEDLGCELCRAVSSLLETALGGNKTKEDIARLIAQVCILMHQQGIDENVCNHIVEEFKVWLVL